MKPALRVALVGAGGRMGQAILAAAENESDITIVTKCGRGNELKFSESDAVIDFSSPEATSDVCRACLEHRKPLLIGTSGHSSAQRSIIEKTGESIPIVFASNFSVGVNALFWLTRKAVQLLGPEFDLEIVEMHHRFKKDAPSGTARKLAEILSEARKLDPQKNMAHGREGMLGERPAAEIGMHAIRGGDVVGEHCVIFAGRGEQLELLHRASSREAFARGALLAIRWIVGKPPGIYSMEDVLGL